MHKDKKTDIHDAVTALRDIAITLSKMELEARPDQTAPLPYLPDADPEFALGFSMGARRALNITLNLIEARYKSAAWRWAEEAARDLEVLLAQRMSRLQR